MSSSQSAGGTRSGESGGGVLPQPFDSASWWSYLVGFLPENEDATWYQNPDGTDVYRRVLDPISQNYVGKGKVSRPPNQSTRVLLEGGIWRLAFTVTTANLTDPDEGRCQIAFTDNVDGPSQVLHWLSKEFLIRPNAPSVRYLHQNPDAIFLVDCSAGPQEVVCRARVRDVVSGDGVTGITSIFCWVLATHIRD